MVRPRKPVKPFYRVTYERVRRYMVTNEGWITPSMIERDLRTESPQLPTPDSVQVAVALRTLIDEGFVVRTETGLPYGQPQFKYRWKGGDDSNDTGRAD